MTLNKAHNFSLKKKRQLDLPILVKDLCKATKNVNFPICQWSLEVQTMSAKKTKKDEERWEKEKINVLKKKTC